MNLLLNNALEWSGETRQSPEKKEVDKVQLHSPYESAEKKVQMLKVS